MTSVKMTELAPVPHLKSADFAVLPNQSGTTFVAGAVDLVATLPAVEDCLTYSFIVQTPSATTGLSISPAAADKIMGLGITEADNKDLINTAATDAAGDFVTLVGDKTAGGWRVTACRGTWAREA